MGKLKDLIGQRFGKLIVVSKEPSRKGFVYWKCKCDCGQSKTIMGMSLGRLNYSGTPKSCGCVSHANKRFKKLPFEAIFNRLKANSGVDNKEFNLTLAEYVSFTEQPLCHYCHKELFWVTCYTAGKPYGHNLDRIDNTKGYSVDNCVPCCGRCNRGKTHMFSYDEWYAMTACFRNSKGINVGC